MDRRRTVTFWGLLLLLTSLWLCAPSIAQEATPEQEATAGQKILPAQGASFDRETAPSQGPSLVQAAEPSSEDTPTTASTPQVEKKRPKTMGELFLGKEGGPDARPVDPSESGTQGTLDLSDSKGTPQSWAEQGEVGQSTFVDKLIQVCWSLALVAFLVWLVAKLAEKAGLKQLGVGATPKSLIQILERKRLSPGRSIMLIRVGPKVLAVAATEKGYKTLTEFDGEQLKAFEDAVEDGKQPLAEVPEEGTGVTPADVLRHYLSIIPGTGAKK